MKLEKREITLNEADSLKDMLYMEKNLLCRYGELMEKAERKEVRAELLRLMKETGEEVFFVFDLLKKSRGESK